MLAVLRTFVGIAFTSLRGRRTFFAALSSFQNGTGMNLVASTAGFIASRPFPPSGDFACHRALLLLAGTRFFDVGAWLSAARGFHLDNACASLLPPTAGL